MNRDMVSVLWTWTKKGRAGRGRTGQCAAQCVPPAGRVEWGDRCGVVPQETREGVYRFGSELLGGPRRGAEVGHDGGEGIEGEVLAIFPSTRVSWGRCACASGVSGVRGRGGEGGTHCFLGGGVVLHGCADDPQRLHFDVVRGRGEQALQWFPHTQLFEI
jgi:hypothetical protein